MSYPFPEAEQQIDLPQGTIRYRDTGSGPPLVFVHGLLANGMLWRRVVPHLAAHYRCIVADWPLGAHSVAMPTDADLTPTGVAWLVADFMAALQLDEVTLVGHDTGGGIVQIVLANHPERIARVVLTNCDAFEAFPPRALTPFKYAGFVPGSMLLLSWLLGNHTVQRLFVRLLALGKYPFEQIALDSYFLPFARDAAVRRDLTKFLKSITPRYTLAAAHIFPQRQQPVLLAWAPEDRLIFPIGLAKRLQAAFPNAQLAMIHDAWTFTPEDQPERLAELIAEFVPKMKDVAC